MPLPPTYDSLAAQTRIVRGLVAEGAAEDRAGWAARIALDEAPFAAPDDEGWRTACNRARSLAHSTMRVGPVPYVT